MKKPLCAGMLALLLIVVCLPMPAFASQAQLNHVTDSAGLLTADEVSKLEAEAERISQKYQFSLYIITLQDYQASGSQDLFQFAIDLYDGYHLGWGDDREGAMILLSMADRDYHLHFNSDRANSVFSEYARDVMEENVVDYLRSDDYYGAFREYLDICDYDLGQAAAGTPVEAPESEGIGVFAVIPGLIAALLTGVALCAPMHSAKKATNANAYLVEGSLHLTTRSDTFLHRTVTRQRREPPQERSSSSGGGGSSTYSGSHSGRSGKF